MKASLAIRLSCEVCILAGGLSSRMGRDKARLRVGKHTLLGHVRACARQLLLPVRIVRRDCVPRCGPLGGIYTALASTKADAVLFLSCDMPFVPPILLRQLLEISKRAKAAVFVLARDKAGFPLVLLRAHLWAVTAQIAQGRFSLQNLAQKLKAKSWRVRSTQAAELLNVNTPEDWETAVQFWRARNRAKNSRNQPKRASTR